MINGKEDPLTMSQQSMYDFLVGIPEGDKRHQVYPDGSLLGLSGDKVRKDIVDWLDSYLEPVE
jgi:hypothetical protein